jgi:hypothetical protein
MQRGYQMYAQIDQLKRSLTLIRGPPNSALAAARTLRLIGRFPTQTR